MGSGKSKDLTGFAGVFCPLYFLAVTIAKGSVTSAAFYQIVLFLIFLVGSADRKDSAAVDSCLYDDEHSESFIKMRRI